MERLEWGKQDIKNPTTCGDTSFMFVPNFGRFFKPSLIFMSNFVDDLRATLYYVQHCITRNIAIHTTLHYVQHCIMCNIALRATLHYYNIALSATMHYVQHYITCNIALHATLRYVQHSTSLILSYLYFQHSNQYHGFQSTEGC